VPDDDHLVAAACHGITHVVDGRPGRKQVDGLGVDVEHTGELVAGLACPEERAREDDCGNGVVAEHLLPERACLSAPFLGQGAQLVGLTGRSFRVADEVEAHRTATISAWPDSAT